MIEPLRSRADFEALRNAGRYRRSGPLALRFLAQPSEDSDAESAASPASPVLVKVAYAIGKPVGNAVIRNKIRRRLRVLIGELHRTGAMTSGLYLVIVNPQAVSANFDDLRRYVQDVARP